MEQTVHDGQTEDDIRTGKIKIAILIFVVTVILKGTHGQKHIIIFHACFGMTVVFHGNQHRLLNRHSSQGNCPSSNPNQRSQTTKGTDEKSQKYQKQQTNRLRERHHKVILTSNSGVSSDPFIDASGCGVLT